MHKSKSDLVMCQRDIHMKNEEKKKQYYLCMLVYLNIGVVVPCQSKSELSYDLLSNKFGLSV